MQSSLNSRGSFSLIQHSQRRRQHLFKPLSFTNLFTFLISPPVSFVEGVSDSCWKKTCIFFRNKKLLKKWVPLRSPNWDWIPLSVDVPPGTNTFRCEKTSIISVFWWTTFCSSTKELFGTHGNTPNLRGKNLNFLVEREVPWVVFWVNSWSFGEVWAKKILKTFWWLGSQIFRVEHIHRSEWYWKTKIYIFL